MMRLSGVIIAAALAAIMGTATSCQTVAKSELAVANMMISYDQEAQLGNGYAEQISQEVPMLNDPLADAYVQELGEKLLAHSDPSPLQFTFRVTADPAMNAFAIPGGHCYINAGLIAAADNEAELAAVVGHEINHVIRRHGVRGLVRQYGISMIAQGLSRESAGASQAIQLVQQTGGVLTVRRFGREDEREADYYGVRAMSGAGFDPKYAVSFFEKLKAASGAGGSGFLGQLLSTHPATDERIDNIRQQIATLPPQKDAIADSEDFQNIKAHVIELMKDRVDQQQDAPEATTNARGFRERPARRARW